MKKRAHVWISALLYLLITTVVVVIVLEAGLPLLNNMRDRNIFYVTQEQFTSFAAVIRQLEGQGSQRTFTMDLSAGSLSFANNTGLVYTIVSSANIISPGASMSYGDVELSSGAYVNATQTGDYAVIENNHLLVNFSIFGDSANYTAIDTSNIINNIYFKDSGETLPGSFQFIVNDNPALSTGTGYSELLDTGDNLGYARLKVVMISPVSYTLMFTLRGTSDFIEVDLV